MGALLQDRLADWPSVVIQDSDSDYYSPEQAVQKYRSTGTVQNRVSTESTILEQLQRQLQLRTRRQVTGLCVINLYSDLL
jgi:hypothetical protein